MSELIKYEIELTVDEHKLLTEVDKYATKLRCGCGHLYVLHNDHCCTFCTVPGCSCEWGRGDE